VTYATWGRMAPTHPTLSAQQLRVLRHKDRRRPRPTAINLIPTPTGAARATGVVIPDLKGKVDGVSVRAPVPDGSLTDLVVRLGAEVTADEVNARYRALADTGPLAGILRYSDDPIVSSDIVGDSYSCIFDSDLTMAHGSMVKVFGWYDNEWGYSSRLVDLVQRL